MQVTVTSTAVELPVSSGQRPLIQNLGAEAVYIEHHAGVTPANGFKLDAGFALEMPADLSESGKLYAVIAGAAPASCDVRILVVG